MNERKGLVAQNLCYNVRMKSAFLTIGLIAGFGVFAATDELPDAFDASTGYVTQKAKDGVNASYNISSFLTNDTTLARGGMQVISR